MPQRDPRRRQPRPHRRRPGRARAAARAVHRRRARHEDQGGRMTDAQTTLSDHLMPTYARYPVRFVRGEGARLWDADGNEYLDFLAGISVSSVGHCHPRVVEAIRAQAGELIHVGNLFYTEPMVRLAQRLAEGSLGGTVFFTNSGAEAVEGALKLARKAKSGGEIVVLHRGFHGRTYGALSATPQESKQAPFAPLVPGFVAVAPTAEAIDAAVHDGPAAVLLAPGPPPTLPTPPSARAPPRCCWSRCRARAACTRSIPTSSGRRARPATA